MSVEDQQADQGQQDTGSTPEADPNPGQSRLDSLAEQFTAAGEQLQADIDRDEASERDPNADIHGDDGQDPATPEAAPTEGSAPPSEEMRAALEMYGFPADAFRTEEQAQKAIAARDAAIYREHQKYSQLFAPNQDPPGPPTPVAQPPQAAAAPPAAPPAQAPAATPQAAQGLTSTIDLAKLGITKDNYDASLVDALEQLVQRQNFLEQENTTLRGGFQTHEAFLEHQDRVKVTNEYDALFDKIPPELKDQYGTGNFPDLIEQGKSDIIQKRQQLVDFTEKLISLDSQAGRALGKNGREAFFKRALYALNSDQSQAIARKQVTQALAGRTSAATARPVSRPRAKSGAEAAAAFFDNGLQQLTGGGED